MDDDMDIQPPIKSNQSPSSGNRESKDNLMMGADDKEDPSAQRGTVPLYQDFMAIPPKTMTAAEVAVVYANYLQNVPGFPWQQDDEKQDTTPCFSAPYITGTDAEVITDTQLNSGVFLNIPRSPKLWIGDQLKLRLGQTTFYTTIGKSQGRDGPRLVQYMNNEALGNQKNGLVEIRYEVVRRSKLVGISESLSIHLHRENKRTYKSSSRTRAVRRRRLSQ